MTIQSSVNDKILATPIDTSTVENAPAEMLRDLDQQMEKRADNAMAMTIQYGVRGLTLPAQSEAFKQENEWNSGDDQTQGEMDNLPCGLTDAAESVRDAIGFESYVLWAEIGKSSLTGLELVQETTDKGKLAPRFVESFEILERISYIAYRLRFPEELSSVHDTFHVSNLKKGLPDANLHVSLDEIESDKTLYFVEETVGIMDCEI
nr:putative reverse transcriptase domain-containing protein [Tanacetum cinerariifolium]